MRRVLPAFAVVVLVACTSGSSTTSSDSSPAFPVTFVGEPLSLSIDSTEYWLGLDESGCSNLVVLTGSEYFVPRTNCVGGPPRSTEDCALRASSYSDNPDLARPCEIAMPAVVIGRVLSERDDLVVCFVWSADSKSVSFAPLSDDGLYLEAAAAPQYGVYLYVADGRRLTEPVSADDSDLLMCDDAGPWNANG